jgi:hypothetical protein
MPKQLIYGNVPVPYTAAWTEELQCILAYCPYAKNAAISNVSRRGIGKPKFGTPHMNRQREAIAKGLCDLCGKSLAASTKVSLSQAQSRMNGASPLDVLQVEPLLHRKCAAISYANCPSLKTQGKDGTLRIRQVLQYGVQFAIYSEQGTFEATGHRVKAVSHAKVHLKKWIDRDVAWLGAV